MHQPTPKEIITRCGEIMKEHGLSKKEDEEKDVGAGSAVEMKKD